MRGLKQCPEDVIEKFLRSLVKFGHPTSRIYQIWKTKCTNMQLRVAMDCIVSGR